MTGRIFRVVRRLLPLAVGAGVVAACGVVEGRPEPEPYEGVIDSVFPIEEEVRRFLATVDSVPGALRGGAPSREELVARFIRAVETQDTVAFAELLVQRDEFIGLYYPHTRYTRRPYELAPALLWFQLEQPSARGIHRLLERHGGRPIGHRRTTCPEEPAIEERNRIWEGCTVTIRGADGRETTRRLFGAILERDGIWKFLSYGNDY